MENIKNYIKFKGGRGSIGRHENIGHTGGGSSATPTDWDFAIKYELFNKIGGGFYFYGLGNPASKWWDYKAEYYDLQVFYYSYGETYTNDEGNKDIRNTTSSYILNITNRSIGTLGDAIAHSFYVDSEEKIYVRFYVHNSNGWGWYTYNSHTAREIYSTPSNISYSNGKVTFNCDSSSYVTACEFKKNTTPAPYNGYSDAVRQLFYEAACQETEFNYENKFYNKKFKRWNKTQATIGVNFMSSVSSSLRSTFKGYVQQAIDIINEQTAGSGFSLRMVDGITGGSYDDAVDRNGNGDIQVWWGDYEELFGESVPSNYRYFGTWENNASSSGTYITEATVRLCTEKVWMMNYQGITYEEIVETLGAGNDVRYTANSVYSDFWFTNKNLNSSSVLSPYYNDLCVLELLYNYNLPSNVDNWIIAKTINAPNGARSATTRYNSSGTIDLTFLESGTSYSIRLVSADYDNTSEYSSWKSITTPSRPSNFSWTYSKVQGGAFNLTATEWNNFTAKVNAFREYKYLSAYSFTYAYKGNDFTAAMYNQAVNAIKGISGYGSYLSTVSKGDTVTAAGLNLLRDELNAIP
ncbi:MAG: hypothetical protein IKW06_00020 [Clostridia bacterium]|nr:hypothetical protein [Clostridia bacterium]